jgi:hypothetical protein
MRDALAAKGMDYPTSRHAEEIGRRRLRAPYSHGVTQAAATNAEKRALDCRVMRQRLAHDRTACQVSAQRRSRL